MLQIFYDKCCMGANDVRNNIFCALFRAVDRAPRFDPFHKVISAI